jgi:hypothetical protein
VREQSSLFIKGRTRDIAALVHDETSLRSSNGRTK